MSCKRSCEDQDPDYEDDLAKDHKRLRLIEKDNVEATVKKIEKIIEAQFAHEMKLKETEIDTIDERLYEARQMLDQLRAGIIISYYSFDNTNETTVGQKSSESKLPVHPAVRKLLGKIPASKPVAHHGKLSVIQPSYPQARQQPIVKNTEVPARACVQTKDLDSLSQGDESRAGRLKVKKRIIVGNVSKYIPLDQREDRDQSTHKWMVYVRGPKEDPSIRSFVSKVWFFLHPSYRPNDIVEINQPPFHLTRRGWGEFPVRVQLHFRDPRNKRVDIIHTLRLDKTYTGLQTLGAETVVEVVIFKDDDVVNCPLRDQQQHEEHIPYSLPSDTGGISIPARDAEGKNITEKTSTQTSSETLLQCIKQEHLDDENMGVEMCSVSSFINDHGTYVNQAVKSGGLLSESSCNHTDGVGQNEVTIKQEPPDYVETTEEMALPSTNDKKLASLIKMSSPISLLNSVKNSSVLRKEVNTNKTNSANSMSGKTTLVLSANVNKSGPTAVSILNSKQKLSNQSIITVPKTNASLPILVVPQKSPSSSSASVSSSLNSSGSESILQLRAQLVSSSQSTDSPPSSGGSKEVEQKLQTGNGVATFVKCIDKQGNVYLIPLPMFLKMSPSAQANLVRDAANIQNSGNSIESAISLNSVHLSTTNTEVGSNSDSRLSFGVKHSKVTHTSEASNVLSKSIQLSENSHPAISGICKQKWTPTVSSPGKQMLSLTHNQTSPNNIKSFTFNDSTISVNIDDFDDFSYVIRHVGKKHPLIAPHPDRSLYPYCANTLEDFLNWNVGKRHAAEWQRAKAVREKLIELVGKSTRWKSIDMWTTKQLYVWFRCHGYSPLKYEPTDSQVEEPSPFSRSELNTYTEACHLVQRLAIENNRLSETTCDSSEDEDDEDVDILTGDDHQKVNRKLLSTEKSISSSAICLPFNKEGIIVQETCRQIGINLQLEEICHDVVAPLAETVLLSSMKSFLEDVIGLAVAERFKRTENKRCPSCIDVDDVSLAICRLPVADFLTNSGLGTKVTTKTFLIAKDIKL